MQPFILLVKKKKLVNTEEILFLTILLRVI